MTSERQQLSKTPTGIEGLDEITNGGLPRGRKKFVGDMTDVEKIVVGLKLRK